MKWTDEQKPMKPSAIEPLDYNEPRCEKFGRFMKACLLLILIVLLPIALSGCSKAVSITPMPPPPANLASDCNSLEQPPEPLIDPERAVWESALIAAYGDCAVKHRLTVEAWERAVNAGK